MSITIPGTLVSLPLSTQSNSNNANAQSAQVVGITRAKPNTTGTILQLTEAQRVQQLYRNGYTVPQITSSLDLSAQAVDRYLDISA